MHRRYVSTQIDRGSGLPYCGEGNWVRKINQVALLSLMCLSVWTELTNIDIMSDMSNSDTNHNNRNGDGNSNDGERPSPRRLGVHGGRMASICTVEGQRPRPTQEPKVLWRCEVVLQDL